MMVALESGECHLSLEACVRIQSTEYTGHDLVQVCSNENEIETAGAHGSVLALACLGWLGFLPLSKDKESCS